MPRIHHIGHAQPRYARVPVLDETTGEPLVTPIARTTKTGQPVTMTITAADKNQPLDPETCERCQAVIRPRNTEHPGDPYKWVQPKSGPYGGQRRVRCASCPGWQPWELTSALWARLAEIEHVYREDISSATCTEDVENALSDAAGLVEEIADEKDEAGQNVEEGFQHETGQSQDLKDAAERLRDWADEIRNAVVPDLPEPGETDCESCEGTGKATHDLMASAPDCENCKGAGTVTPDNPADDQMDEWRSEAADLLGDSPV